MSNPEKINPSCQLKATGWFYLKLATLQLVRGLLSRLTAGLAPLGGLLFRLFFFLHKDLENKCHQFNAREEAVNEVTGAVWRNVPLCFCNSRAKKHCGKGGHGRVLPDPGAMKVMETMKG